MQLKSNSLLTHLLILAVFGGIFFISFIKSHQAKGTFWADETGVVSSSITKGRTLKRIFYDAAFTSQPPLDHIIREKIYVPLGENLTIAKSYPEFFHRLPALLWWLLPLGYFAFHLKNFSDKNKSIILLALSLLVSSQFLRHYLAEARHYSAIPAVFTAMIIILLSDQIKLNKLKYHFLVISSLFPFLHIISFPFYLAAMALFFYQIRKELTIRITFGYTVFIALVILMYREIQQFSSPWQHPAWENLLAINPVNSYLKWTLDWIFSGGILYPAFKIIPENIKNNLLLLFAISSGFILFRFSLLLIKKKFNFINLPNLLLMNLVFIWPVSIFATIYFSGMFSGERYSIVLIPIILFYISYLIISLIWKVFSTGKIRMSISLLLIILSLTFMLIDVLPVDILAIDTPDNQFVKNNASILRDKDAYLILDNGVYSAAFFPLSAIQRTPVNINYLQCRDGNFQTTGHNTLNDWLNEHQKDNVYLYSIYLDFMEPSKIIWQNNGFVLYRLTHVPETELCQSPGAVGECYIRCIRGADISPDGRSIKGVGPNLGIYRR